MAAVAKNDEADNILSLSADEEEEEGGSLSEPLFQSPVKILFLDIDGVLNTFDDVLQMHERHINKEHLSRLTYIVDKTHCKIVLSTSWRNIIQKKRELWEELSKVGLIRKELILGERYEMTPDLCPFEQRTDEIIKALDDIKRKTKVCSWVVLDDMDLLKKGQKGNRERINDHFIQCDPEHGLTDKQSIEAISILNS